MMAAMEHPLAPESVVEWAWSDGRSDILGWRDGWPIYQRSNWAEVVGHEIGDRALEYLYDENTGKFRWPPSLSELPAFDEIPAPTNPTNEETNGPSSP